MKKLCVRVGEDSRFGFKKGDLIWVKEAKYWGTGVVYNLIGEIGFFVLGNEVVSGRVFILV